MGQHFMLLLSIYVLYSNLTYIYPVSCPVEIKLFQIVSNFSVAVLMRKCSGERSCMHVFHVFYSHTEWNLLSLPCDKVV